MTPLPSLLAACQISITGWTALAGLAFLAVFGERISNHRTHRGNRD